MKKILSIIILSLCLCMTQLAQEKPLKYNIYVNVKLLPVLALDSHGNPVLDLKKEEIELYINGKPYKIEHFKRCDFESTTIKKEEIVPEENERVVFIIVDAMFNSKTGFRRSKEIAADLVKAGKAGDHFIVFENNSFSGLRYIGGSDQSRDKLIKKIKKIRRPIEKWPTQLYNNRALSNNIDFSIITDSRLETGSWESLRNLTLASEKLRYKYLVKQFGRVLSHFKYILKTVNKPKMVFLISEGMAKGAFDTDFNEDENNRPVEITDQRQLGADELRSQRFQLSVLSKDERQVSDENKVYSTLLFSYLKDIVKSINYGGSVMYTVNPKRLDDTNDERDSGEMSLRYLASESGGKYFAGSDAGKIVKRIEKTTSSYYEMAFYTDPEDGQNLQIRLKCKRKGVRVNTANYAEGSRSYREMDPIQKKMFALNVASGGNWSRAVGKVLKVRHKKNKNEKGDKNEYTLFIPLPKEMKNKKLDMYLIHLDTKTQRVDMNIVKKDAKDWIKLTIEPLKNKKQYFVIIEPSETLCIYNKAL